MVSSSSRTNSPFCAGYPPFIDKSHQALFRKIRGADFTFHDEYWKDVSVSAKQLIAALLQTDPKYRWTAAEALRKSTWLKAKAEELSKRDLSSSLTELRKLQRKRRLKGAAHTVLWGVKHKLANEAEKQAKDGNRTSDDGGGGGLHYHDDEEQKKRVDDALVSSTQSRVDDALVSPTQSSTIRFEEVYQLTDERPFHSNPDMEIWSCQHKERKEVYAVKIINDDPDKMLSNGKSISESVLHELAVLKSLKHAHIIAIIDFFEQDGKFYLVMEKMDGGDVFDRIISLQKYTEMDARNLFKILLDAVYCMHSKGKKEGTTSDVCLCVCPRRRLCMKVVAYQLYQQNSCCHCFR